MSEEFADDNTLKEIATQIGTMTDDDMRFALGFISATEPDLVIEAIEIARETR